MDYETVFREIVKEAEEIVGTVAITQANKIEGVTVTEDHEIDADHQLGKEDIEALIDRFHGLMGKAAHGIGRRALESLATEYAHELRQLELPTEILPAHLVQE